jgi:hypothetical protein
VSAEVFIFGVRHHGPGSARTLLRALDAVQPDALLIEGPPDADPLIALAGDESMQPPAALLVYETATPSNAAFYPFARFSPEWQALRFALDRALPVRFMDLPVANQIPLERTEHEQRAETPHDDDDNDDDAPTPAPSLRHDPLGHLARAAGFADGERWWEQTFERPRAAREDPVEVFTAVLEAMRALRDAVADEQDEPEDPDLRIESLREASMRRLIRSTMRQHARTAVVCGAWHAPALATMPPATADTQRLKGLPKVKVSVTWTPWTHRRLSAASGYRAGVRSPGWYDHLWRHTDAIAERWLTRVAQLLRAEDLDASSAHVIESSRLAATLAAMRDRAIPDLDDLTEATEAVFCAGDPTPLALIEDRLIVGDRLGAVPDSAPTIPLHDDLHAAAKRLRLKMSADERDLDLDLRKDFDLERSHLLHRLNLLNLPWGERQTQRTRTSSFHERWTLRWHPEFAVRVIEGGAWGNTVAAAATNRVRALAADAGSIAELTDLVDDALLADLPDAASALVRALDDRAAVDTDIAHLMAAFAPLARVTRYGNVRKSDTDMLLRVIDGLAARICAGLPPASRSLGEDAARALASLVVDVNAAVALMTDTIDPEPWREALHRIATDDRAAPCLGGRACRLLLDAGAIDAQLAGTRLSLALSHAQAPADASAWVEGFLAGSGLVLLHDDQLFAIIDAWIGSRSDDHFEEILPILRRTFAAFAPSERRMIGERVRQDGAHAPSSNAHALELDLDRAEHALDVYERILQRADERTEITP